MSGTLTGRYENGIELDKVANLIDDSGALEVEPAVEKLRPTSCLTWNAEKDLSVCGAAREGEASTGVCISLKFKRSAYPVSKGEQNGITVGDSRRGCTQEDAGGGVGGCDNPQQELERKKFATGVGELGQLGTWLESKEVSVVVMESTAQYGKPVWLALEEKFVLHLAQAQSNAAPRGRKSDFVDALRLARRFLASELKLSFVPGEEQRRWRCLSRSKHQLRRQRVRLHSQIEALLEESQIKLSSVVTDLLGATGQRLLEALVAGETDPEKLAGLAANNLKVSQPELVAALVGKIHEAHRIVLGMQLQQLALIDRQMGELHLQLGKALRIHEEPLARLCEIPGLKEDAAEQILPELGPEAAVFASAEQMASWIGVCPGREESAGESWSNRSPKGNRTMRRLLNQIAWGAVRTKGCFFKELFHRLVPRLGVHKAIWAIAHRIAKVIWKVLHDKVRYIERGPLAQDPKAMRRRVAALTRQMRKLGYTIEVKPIAVTSN